MKIRPLPLLILALLGPAAGKAQEEPARPELTKERIRWMEIALDGSVKEHDVERFKSYLAPEAVFLGDEASRGPEEIAAAWKLFFEKDGLKISHEVEEVVASASGDLAYVIGQATVSKELPSGREHTRPGPYLTAWIRNADGPWKMLGSGALVVCLADSCKKTVDRKTALAEVWEPLRSTPDDVTISSTPEVVREAAAGGLAFHVGTYTLEAHGEADSQAATGGYLSVLRKDDDGVWQVVAESFSVPK